MNNLLCCHGDTEIIVLRGTCKLVETKILLVFKDGIFYCGKGAPDFYQCASMRFDATTPI